MNTTLTDPITYNITAGVAASDPQGFVISRLWNSSSVIFSGLVVNATNFGSANGSVLADFKLGNVTRASIDKNGSVRTPKIIFDNAGVASEMSAPLGTAPIFACRAYGRIIVATNGTITSQACFNATASVAGIGDVYKITFTTPMADSNYIVLCTSVGASGGVNTPWTAEYNTGVAPYNRSATDVHIIRNGTFTAGIHFAVFG